MLGRGVPLKWGQKSKGWVPEPLEKTNQFEENVTKGGAITSFSFYNKKETPSLGEGGPFWFDPSPLIFFLLESASGSSLKS